MLQNKVLDGGDVGLEILELVHEEIANTGSDRKPQKNGQLEDQVQIFGDEQVALIQPDADVGHVEHKNPILQYHEIAYALRVKCTNSGADYSKKKYLKQRKENEAEAEIEEELEEDLEILLADAVAGPGAVVVEAGDALVADRAVPRPDGFEEVALDAVETVAHVLLVEALDLPLDLLDLLLPTVNRIKSLRRLGAGALQLALHVLLAFLTVFQFEDQLPFVGNLGLRRKNHSPFRGVRRFAGESRIALSRSAKGRPSRRSPGPGRPREDRTLGSAGSSDLKR